MKTVVGEGCWAVCVVWAIRDEAVGVEPIKVGLLRWAWGEGHWDGGCWGAADPPNPCTQRSRGDGRSGCGPRWCSGG